MLFKKRKILIIFALLSFLFSGCFSLKNNENKKSIECSIYKKDRDNTLFLISNEELSENNIEYGDSINIKFSNGKILENIPYYSDEYAPYGEPVLTIRDSGGNTSLVFSKGKGTWIEYNLSENDTAFIELNEKERYKEIQDGRNIKYSNNRKDYESNEVFANFRNIKTGQIKEGILYRGASPVNNERNRASVSDKLCEENNINYILDLSDNTDSIKKYFEKEDFNSPYFKKLYDDGKVVGVNTSVLYATDSFCKKAVEGLKYISENEGPYYIHCVEGKDRTGFECILIEMLCKSSYEEIKNDFLKSFENYYSLTEENNPENIQVIINTMLDPMIKIIVNDENADIYQNDLSEYAERFIEKYGMNEDEIEVLKEKLMETKEVTGACEVLNPC